MTELMRFFWQLVLLRRLPQDLPSSAFLLHALLLLNVGLSFVLGMPQIENPLLLLGISLFELALSASLLYFGLLLRGTPKRWLQSYSALLGVGAFFALLLLIVRALETITAVTGLSELASLLVFFWVIAAMAHVLRHSLEIPLAAAIVIVFLYTMLVVGLTSQWLPMQPTVGQS